MWNPVSRTRSTAGDSKDRLILAAMALIALGAVAAGVWSIADAITPDWKQDLVYYECVDPACGHSRTLTIEECSEQWEQIPPEIRPGLTQTELPCPRCGREGYSSARGFQCPKCKEFSLSPVARAQVSRRLRIPAQRPRGPVMCPHCGVDVLAHRRSMGATTGDE